MTLDAHTHTRSGFRCCLVCTICYFTCLIKNTRAVSTIKLCGLHAYPFPYTLWETQHYTTGFTLPFNTNLSKGKDPSRRTKHSRRRRLFGRFKWEDKDVLYPCRVQERHDDNRKSPRTFWLRPPIEKIIKKLISFAVSDIEPHWLSVEGGMAPDWLALS